jgi:hypothetical protein
MHGGVLTCGTNCLPCTVSKRSFSWHAHGHTNVSAAELAKLGWSGVARRSWLSDLPAPESLLRAWMGAGANLDWELTVWDAGGGGVAECAAVLQRTLLHLPQGTLSPPHGPPQVEEASSCITSDGSPILFVVGLSAALAADACDSRMGSEGRLAEQIDWWAEVTRLRCLGNSPR